MADNGAFSANLEANEKLFHRLIGHQRGAVFRRLSLPGSGGGQPISALLIFFEASVDQPHLELAVVRPLLEGEVAANQIPSRINISTTLIKTVEEAIAFVFRGKVLLFVDGMSDVYALEVAAPPHRDITAPETESAVSGPRESLSELLVVNLSMLRRRFPGPELRVEAHWIGQNAKLEAVLVYLAGRPTNRMLATVRSRLNKVKVDGIQDITELTDAISDTHSVFPTVLRTERPDLIVHFMKAGRVVVLLDNSPRALVVPALFMDYFASADDFYEWRPFVAFLRLLRFLAFLIAVPLPALYVSVTTYHLQALPTQLTLSLLAQREGAPLPAPVEALVMTLIFELLREAGIRLPKTVGPTVSIVGGLVIGEAAIRSGLTSPAMVLVVTASAVATFSLPSTALANAATYLRFFVLLFSIAFGFFGVLVGYLVTVANLAGMTSLGVPYMTPLFPFRLKELSTALATKHRPPEGTGTGPEPELTAQAEDYQERRV